MSGVVERLHALLAQAVTERRGVDAAGAPVTVAEIYQELVPYRAVRAALGLEMNADYEHALLRLLSGESELARLEPPTAREQLREELASPNPNVTLYRKYAGCDVFLSAPVTSTDWVTSQLLDDEPPVAWEAGGSAADALDWSVEELEEIELPLAEIVEDEEVAVRPAPGRSANGSAGSPAALSTSHAAGSAAPRASETHAHAEAAPGAEETTSPEAPAHAAPPPTRAPELIPDAAETETRIGQSRPCAFCDSPLPRGRAIRFCPYCGADQSMRPCAACGEALEGGWAFCIACGAPADVGA